MEIGLLGKGGGVIKKLCSRKDAKTQRCQIGIFSVKREKSIIWNIDRMGTGMERGLFVYPRNELYSAPKAKTTGQSI